MPAEDSSHDDALAALAEYLRRESPQIVSEWVEAVRADTLIVTADRLTFGLLQDHFPQMLEELAELFPRPGAPAVDSAAEPVGREHGRSRWRQGYRIDEMLRELSRMRDIVAHRVKRFFREANASACEEASATVGRFFDAIAASSARQYVQEQEPETILRSRQLQSAYERVQAATDELRTVAQSRLRLVRGVSHELRNALQALALAAEALLDENGAPSREAAALELRANAIRLQRLLDRLQILSGILAGEAELMPELVQITQVFTELDSVYRPLAYGKGIGLEFLVTLVPPLITIDLAKLKTIADALVSNAVEFTERGIVRVTALGDAPGRWVLRVQDTGIGIGLESRETIFTEFHPSSGPAKAGLGLGLVVARHLAHLLDGEITFESEVGKGSVFDLNLPTRSS